MKENNIPKPLSGHYGCSQQPQPATLFPSLSQDQRVTCPQVPSTLLAGAELRIPCRPLASKSEPLSIPASEN